jgi:hypothetical protein
LATIFPRKPKGDMFKRAKAFLMSEVAVASTA